MRNTNKYPSIDDITMVMPIEVNNYGVKVKLIEYDDIDGFILMSDLSRSRFRSINKIITIGKKFPACVLSIDDKDYVLLSKKIVTENEQNECQETFAH